MRLLMLSFSVNCITFIHAQNHLFPITEKGLKGFIDDEETVAVEPKFKTIKLKKGPLSIFTVASFFLIKKRQKMRKMPFILRGPLYINTALNTKPNNEIMMLRTVLAA
jgi:hypothetical protein